MRRAVILATLALLLLAVAGVTAAQEGVFESAEPDENVSSGITVPENTAPEPTSPERTIPETTAPEETAPEETAPEDEGGPEEPTEDDAERLGDGDEGPPQDPGEGAEEDLEGDAGRGRDKAVVCHKDKKTLTVGAPAEDAHLRHGDTPGACAGGPPEDTPGNGNGGGGGPGSGDDDGQDDGGDGKDRGGGPPQGAPGRGGR